MPSQDKGSKGGFPIRRFLDQSSFAAPQDLSQRTTSFIASQRQGIHQMLLRHLITLMINVRPAKAEHDHQRKTCLWISPKTCFACQAYPAHTAAGRGWFAGTRSSRWPNMLPLYDFKHPRRSPTKGRARTSFDFRIHKKWWSLSGSNRRPDAGKATALPAALRPIFAWPQAPAGRSGHLAPRAMGRGGRSAFAKKWCRVDATASQARLGARADARGSQGNGRCRRRLRLPNMVGLGRLERPTSPLSGVRSNHLSYRPQSKQMTQHPGPDRCIRNEKRNEDGSVPHVRA
jgi:hypothetical protein